MTSNLFLCAFLITLPVATTNKSVEVQKANEILKQFSERRDYLDESRVLEASDQAITLARNMAIGDYMMNTVSDVRMRNVERGKGFIERILNVLTGLF